jgi:uncharacterized membrane protein YqjE
MSDSGRLDREGTIPSSRESANTGTGGGDSLGSLVTGIVEDLQHVVRGEVQLAKTELKEDAGKLGKGAGMLAAGAMVGLVGFTFLMLALTYLLNKSMQMWLAAGTVGLALVILAAIVAMTGKNQMSAANLKPQQTIDSVKEDQEWASHQIKSVRK